MDETQAIKVTYQDGFLGWLEPGERPESSDRVTVQTENGARIIVPSSLFVPVKEGEYFLPLGRDQLDSTRSGFIRGELKDQGRVSSVDKLETGKSGGKKRGKAAHDEQATLLVIPVIAEQLEVSTRQSTTGKVRVTRQVSERVETVDEPLLREEVDVERRPVDRLVDTPPEVRVEGETTIIPVIEEVLVVEKRYRVKEEVRVTRTRKEISNPQEFNLRSEEVKVEHVKVGEKKD